MPCRREKFPAICGKEKKVRGWESDKIPSSPASEGILQAVPACSLGSLLFLITSESRPPLSERVPHGKRSSFLRLPAAVLAAEGKGIPYPISPRGANGEVPP